MIVVSRGRGFVVAIVTGGCLLGLDWLTALRYHDSNYYAQHGWPKLLAFLTSAVIIWVMSSHRDDETLPGAPVDPQKKPFFRERDSLFFIPVKYWPGILCALGLLFYFIRSS